MIIIYLDIETYSPQDQPKFSDKIITIQFQETRGDPIILKEWDKGENHILTEFYKLLKQKIKLEKFVMLIGFNIFPFDIPFLTYQLHFHKIDSLENILGCFKTTFIRDLRQNLLPFNKYRFKGLSADVVAKKLHINTPMHSNRSIKDFYEKCEYDKIEEHALSDLRLLSDLSRKMWDLKEITTAFEDEG